MKNNFFNFSLALFLAILGFLVLLLICPFLIVLRALSILLLVTLFICQSLVELICNVQSMEEAVIEMKYDTKKAPLGESRWPRVCRLLFLLHHQLCCARTETQCLDLGWVHEGDCGGFSCKVPVMVGFFTDISKGVRSHQTQRANTQFSFQLFSRFN